MQSDCDTMKEAVHGRVSCGTRSRAGGLTWARGSTEAQHASPRLPVRTRLAMFPHRPMEVTEAQPRSRTTSLMPSQVPWTVLSKDYYPNHPTPGGPSQPVGGNLVGLLVRLPAAHPVDFPEAAAGGHRQQAVELQSGIG